MVDVVTSAGRTQAAGYLSNVVAPPANYYGAVGTGAGTAAIGDTTLFTEAGSARIVCALSRVGAATDTAQYTFTYTATGTISVTNAGVFTALTVGTLMQKSDHATIPLLNTDSIAYTFKNQQV